AGRGAGAAPGRRRAPAGPGADAARSGRDAVAAAHARAGPDAAQEAQDERPPPADRRRGAARHRVAAAAVAAAPAAATTEAGRGAEGRSQGSIRREMTLILNGLRTGELEAAVAAHDVPADVAPPLFARV